MRLAGRTAEELAGRHIDLLAHPDDPAVGDLGLDPAPGEPPLDPHLLNDGERRLRRSDNSELWVVQSHEVVPQHRRPAVRRPLAGGRDRPPAREEDLVRRAFVDPLTGTPNARASPTGCGTRSPCPAAAACRSGWCT